jgi:two-component system response regulator PilR (NtrC family)
MSERALRAIERHPLPGNVRELENLLHRALALSADGELNFDEIDMPPCADEPSAKGEDQPSPSGYAVPADLQTWLDEQERTVITRVLNETGFNRTAAAARLGLNLRQMRYRMARLAIAAPSPGIDPDEPS